MANYLNRPSIFEIATAFNNGTPPQHDGYEKTYYSLSNDERNFVFRHPWLAYKFNDNANKARNAVEVFRIKRMGTVMPSDIVIGVL